MTPFPHLKETSQEAGGTPGVKKFQRKSQMNFKEDFFLGHPVFPYKLIGGIYIPINIVQNILHLVRILYLMLMLLTRLDPMCIPVVFCKNTKF